MRGAGWGLESRMKTFNLELGFPRMTRRILMSFAGGRELACQRFSRCLSLGRTRGRLWEEEKAGEWQCGLVRRPEFTSELGYLVSSSTFVNHFKMQIILTLEDCLRVK